MIVGVFVIGTVLFFPMRWLFTRNKPEARKSPKVPPSGYLQIALVVAVMLMLAWHMEAGNKIASIIWAVLGIGGSVWLFFVRKKLDDGDH